MPEGQQKSGGSGKSWWDRTKERWNRLPRWGQWAIGVFAALIVIAALVGEEEEGSDGGGEPAVEEQQAQGKQSGESEAQDQSEPGPEAPPAEPDPRDEVRAALEGVDGPVEDPEVKEVSFSGGSAVVTIATPEGGFEGPSVQDVDWMASAVLSEVYGDAGWGKDAEVIFEGGLVDTRTGQSLDDAMTAKYVIMRREARQIDWSDEDTVTGTIDWSFYREFTHPALKQD